VPGFLDVTNVSCRHLRLQTSSEPRLIFPSRFYDASL